MTEPPKRSVAMFAYLVLAVLVASVVGGLVCLWLAFQLLVRRRVDRVSDLADLSAAQRLAARVPHGKLILVVGLWYLALPAVFVALELPHRLLGALLMVGVGVGTLGQLFVRRLVRDVAAG